MVWTEMNGTTSTVLKRLSWYSLPSQTVSPVAAVCRKTVRTLSWGRRRWRLLLKPVLYYTMPLNDASVGRHRKLPTVYVLTPRQRFFQSPKIH